MSAIQSSDRTENGARDFATIMKDRVSRPRSGRVIIRRCDQIQPDAIRKILEESFVDLGIKPHGKVLIKPNVVTANRAYIHHSYTDPRIVAESIRFLRAQGISNLTVGESGGFGIPSRLFMHEAGYLDLAREGARIVDFNTERARRVELTRGQHHKSMMLSDSLYDADFLMWMPKLKYHIFATFTCALKLNIGILRHEERMLYHDDRVDEKIVDLLEVGYPDVIVTDAVEIGHGFESAPYPLHLGALLISDDPVAMDVVAGRALGYEPKDCGHLTIALQRGYGPKSLSDVKVDGDMPLDELRAKTAGVESEFQDIHKVRTPIRFYCGTDPDRGRPCHGGCIGAVKGALGTIDKRRPGSVARAKEGAIVTGVYKGDVDAGAGTALLLGSCTRVEGTIKAGKIRRVAGCPIAARTLLLALPRYFRLPSPMADLGDAVLFIVFSIDKLFRKLLSFTSRPAPKLPT